MASSVRAASTPANIHYPHPDIDKVRRSIENERRFTPAALTLKAIQDTHRVALRAFDGKRLVPLSKIASPLASSLRPASTSSHRLKSPVAKVRHAIENEKSFTHGALTLKTLQDTHGVTLRAFDGVKLLPAAKATASPLAGRSTSASPTKGI